MTTRDGADVTVEHLVGLGTDKQAHVQWGWDGLTTTVYVRDFNAYGFKKRTNTAAGPMTDEQKAERKALIANNKAWNSVESSEGSGSSASCPAGLSRRTLGTSWRSR